MGPLICGCWGKEKRNSGKILPTPHEPVFDMEKMNFSKPLIIGALTSFLGLVFLSEILLRLTVPSGFWYRHLDLSADFTSLPEVRDRLQFGDRGGESRALIPSRRVLILGDSVLGASALMEHRLPGARTLTLGRFLNRELGIRGFRTLILGADGVLLPDILALSEEFLPAKEPASTASKPEKILLLLNFRMFAQDFVSGPKALSRDFFRVDLPPSVVQALGADPKKTNENRLSDKLYDLLCRHCFLFRETQMAKTLWYYPSQKDFFQRQLEHFMGPPPEEEDLIEAGLKLKIATYYQAYHWPDNVLPYQSLAILLEKLKNSQIPVEIVLTPQNPEFLGDYFDRPSYEFNRKGLKRFMQTHYFQGLDYQDWSNRYGPPLFLDHCHLTPEGNQSYAKDLSDLLAGKGKS